MINHPPNHHFYGWYKPFNNGWFMTLRHTHITVAGRTAAPIDLSAEHPIVWDGFQPSLDRWFLRSLPSPVCGMGEEGLQCGAPERGVSIYPKCSLLSQEPFGAT